LKAAGFSLIEVLVATAVVIVGAASLAQLLVVSARAGRIAAATSTSLALAERRMEKLLGDLASVTSTPDVLSASTPGDVDYLDANGVSLGVTTVSLPANAPPPETAYICRWSIVPLPDSPAATVVVQVSVTPWPLVAGQARLVSVKWRKAS
jgi:prepilin-type N-terminal cleavage/methylation domain-containing protein